MGHQTITFEVGEQGIARLTLNRPLVKNAMNGEMYDEARAVIAAVDADPSVRVLVLTGAGDAFCSGGDFQYQQSQRSRKHGERIAEASKLALWLRELDTLSKPVIGRINGPAYGGGVGLVAICDLVVCAEDVKFCLSEVSLGLLPSMIAPYVVRKIGISNARSIFLNAALFGAEEARSMRLVHEVVPRGELDAATLRQAGRFLRCAPSAITATKRLVDFVDRHDFEENFRYTVDRVAEMWSSDDAEEGIRSFLEKRKPGWFTAAN